MKAKTVWKPTGVGGSCYWRPKSGLIWFANGADVRWVNCFGEDVSSRARLELKGTGKILGDE